MKVAVLGIKTMPAYAGADRVAERLVEAMPAHDFTVYVLRGGGAHPAVAHRRYVEVPALKGKHLSAFSYFLLCTLHFLVRGDAEVVHVHNSDFGLFCPLLKLKRGVRVVGTLHGSHRGPAERDKWGWGARVFLRTSEWVFVRSCDVVTTVALVPGVYGPDVRHIPNGVDLYLPSDDSLPAEIERLGVDRGDFVMFACGRLDRSKGLHHLLAAYRGLSDAPPLLAIGDFRHDPPYSAEIEAQARQDARVILYRSLLGREELFQAVAGSMLFVFPSEFEAMSMMLLEVIACEKAVVCSDIPENRTIVGDDYPLLFRSGMAEDLRAVLARALALEVDQASLERSFEHVRTAFRWDRIAEAYDRAYRGVFA